MIILILSVVFGVLLLGSLYPIIDYNGVLFLASLMGPVLYVMLNGSMIKRSFRLLFEPLSYYDAEDTIGMFIDMANISRKDGILALEKIKAEDPFHQSLINHCVDGADPEFLKSVAEITMTTYANYRRKVVEFIDKLGFVAVVWAGTVSFAALDPNPMVYGLITFLSLTFMSAILKRKIENKRIIDEIATDGMIGIQKGVNPRMLQEALKSRSETYVNEGYDNELY